MKQEDFVSCALAVTLKAAGFGEPCEYYYAQSSEPDNDTVYLNGDPRFPQDYNNPQEDCPFLIPLCSAPSLWQAQKWLRSKGIEVYVLLAADNDRYEWSIYDRNVRDNIDSNRGDDYKTYESALSAGIAAALELIKKGEKDEK